MDRCSIEAGLLPQFSGHGDRIKLDRFPPCRFVAPAMEHKMVGTAKRNHELVTDPAAQRARLGKSQMVGVRRPPSAQQAGLRGYELQVRAIAVAARFAMRKSAFVDVPGNGVVHIHGCVGSYGSRLKGRRRYGGRMLASPSFAAILSNQSGRFALDRVPRNFRVVGAEARTSGQGLFIEPTVRKSREPRCERSLHEACICSREGAFCGDRPLRPGRGLFLRAKAGQFAQQLVAQGG
jgi:hypothetical protein